MRQSYSILLCLLFCSTLFSQIESNEYIEVIQSYNKNDGHMQYAGNGLFFFNHKNPDQKSYLMDALGNEFLPTCQRLEKGGSSLDESDLRLKTSDH